MMMVVVVVYCTARRTRNVGNGDTCAAGQIGFLLEVDIGTISTCAIKKWENFMVAPRRRSVNQVTVADVSLIL